VGYFSSSIIYGNFLGVATGATYPAYFNTPPTNSYYPWSSVNGGLSYDITSSVADRLLATPSGSTANSFVHPAAGQLHAFYQQQQQDRHSHHLQHPQHPVRSLSDAATCQARSGVDDDERKILPLLFQTESETTADDEGNETTEYSPSTKPTMLPSIKRSSSASDLLQTATISGHLVLPNSLSGFSAPGSALSSVLPTQRLTAGTTNDVADRMLLQSSSAASSFLGNDGGRHGRRLPPSYNVSTAAAVAAAAAVTAGALRHRGMFNGGHQPTTKASLSCKLRGSRSSNAVKSRSHSGRLLGSTGVHCVP
jgi:hypothetical protein